MIVTDMIREANTEDEVYFFLTAYVETMRFCDKLEYMPEQMLALPLTGKDDLQLRSEKLIVELDLASKRLDDKACLVIKEALAIFSTALNCLRSFDYIRPLPRAGIDKQRAKILSAGGFAESDLRAAGLMAVSEAIPGDLRLFG